MAPPADSQRQRQQQAAEQLLLQLLRYDLSHQRRLFQDGVWPCGICLEHRPGSECCWASTECRHAYCRACLARVCGLAVEEGVLENLRCPEPKCKRPLDRQVVLQCLTPEQALRLGEVELERSLQGMVDAVRCPRCETVALEDETHCAQCSKCLFVFCSLCGSSWHPGVQCVSPEVKLQMLRERLQGGAAGRANVEELRRRYTALQDEAMVRSMARLCPRCNEAIIKAEGCNKVVCRCGQKICFKCGKAISGYDHFMDGGECNLFDMDEILRWERQMEMQDFGDNNAIQRDVRVERDALAAFEARARGGRVRGACCPTCGQQNVKQGNNNHMRCWNCQCSFCYLCKRIVRRGEAGKHFGNQPDRCRQHGAN